MKLTKARVKEIFHQMIGFGNYCEKYVVSLQGHIEALEQELAVKPQYVVTNVWLPSFGKAGAYLEVKESDDHRWIVVNGVCKGVTFHKSHASDVDINKLITEFRQENLMRLEEVKGLQAELDRVNKLSNHRLENGNVILNQRAELHEKLKAAYIEVSRLNTAYEAEKEARMLLEATLERAILNHQPLAVHVDIVNALDRLKAAKLNNYQIVALSNFTAVLGRDYSKEVIEDLKTVQAFENSGEGGRLLAVLVNGYKVEAEPQDETVITLANMLNVWADGDYIGEISIDEQNKVFAQEIIDFLKVNTKN